jgi:hypothetical protein
MTRRWMLSICATISQQICSHHKNSSFLEAELFQAKNSSLVQSFWQLEESFPGMEEHSTASQA